MKKLLPVLLCAAMLLCLLPLEARAAAAAWDGTVDISWYDPAQTEYTIDTPAKLAGLAALVNGMADPAAKAIVGDRSYLVSKKVDNVMLVGAGGGNVFDTVYTGGVDFAYKTIYLTADLDMGGRKAADGSWTGPNWTPIGGKFPMKPQEASGDCLTLDTRFNGVLDGQGHTIYNLYCDRCAAKGFPYSMAVGVVGFLGGNADYANGGNGEKTEAEFKNGWQLAVRNLVLGSGSIYIERRRDRKLRQPHRRAQHRLQGRRRHLRLRLGRGHHPRLLQYRHHLHHLYLPRGRHPRHERGHGRLQLL